MSTMHEHELHLSNVNHFLQTVILGFGGLYFLRMPHSSFGHVTAYPWKFKSTVSTSNKRKQHAVLLRKDHWINVQ